MLSKNKNLHPVSESEVLRQLEIFKKGIPFVEIAEAASAGNGIHIFSKEEENKLAAFYENQKESLSLLKFVPASGAATRMFKFLHQFLKKFNPETDDLSVFLQKKENKQLRIFFESKNKFPFSQLIHKRLIEKYRDFDSFPEGKKFYCFVSEMLDKEGLNFSNTPKGLIPFHTSKTGPVTAFQEHLLEAVHYASSGKKAAIHFTVSKNHIGKFQDHFREIYPQIRDKTQTEFEITFSFQKPETDTVAATLENELFLDSDEKPVFRPSGHGALLSNLNEQDADLIFIKNIDNVVSEEHVETIAFHKKVLAGKLLILQEKIFHYLKKLKEETSSQVLIEEITGFIEKELQISLPSVSVVSLINQLNRPLRVCGVVKNTGAPGGGPFLIKNQSGTRSYQIIEMSQIDLKNPEQLKIVKSATHFNPVDLVCGIKNYKGEKFDLRDFSNPEMGFISEKSYKGKPIKALELPGLWNGSMANWNTVFVEVPLLTFNPVKTVNDLLNPVHQQV